MDKVGNALTTAVNPSKIETLIVENVDSALEELGDSVKKVIYYHLEEKFALGREEIPKNPESFSQGLHSIFGEGAKVIETMIVRKIQEEFELCLDSQSGIVKAIETAKKTSN